MKKLFTTLALMATMIVASAQNYGTTTMSLALTNGFSLLLTTPIQITQIQVLAGGTNVNVGLYDNSQGAITYTNAAYTSILQYSTNMTITATNAQGIISTNTITGGNWRTTQTTAANTNTLNATATIACPASGIATTIGQFNFSRGVTAYLTPTNTSATLNIMYRRLY